MPRPARADEDRESDVDGSRDEVLPHPKEGVGSGAGGNRDRGHQRVTRRNRRLYRLTTAEITRLNIR